MNALVETVVAALAEAARRENERMGIKPERAILYDQDAKDRLGMAAIAAVLDAIAEPTEAMVDAAGYASTLGTSEDEIRIMHRAMIAALRKEAGE